ncbi:MAG: hypothetical protein GKR94_03525 [Gammaproteobacteria bacterium]|nr:hypothetical protein [Gammaproteobacteria bacterium]
MPPSRCGCVDIARAFGVKIWRSRRGANGLAQAGAAASGARAGGLIGMRSASPRIEREAERLLGTQLCLTGLLMLGFWFASGSAAALAAAFGGVIALANAWVMSRAVVRAAVAARHRPGSETMILYIVAVQRFILVAVFFALGIGLLQLMPGQLLIGFAVVHGAFFMYRGFMVKSPSRASGEK